MNKILLDTNAYSRLFKDGKAVLEMLSEADAVYISVFVLAELYHGFKGGTKEAENRATIKRFLDKPTASVLQTTSDTAEYWAHIRTALKKAGTPIPTNDIWIAAHAMETGAQLVTFDRHFELVPGLRVQVVE
jgi:tRNA(fMet)-specific endonuclease VapC